MADIITDFSEFLTSSQVSFNTHKNYLSDIRYFFRWLGNQNLPLSPETLDHYHSHLSTSQSVATANRRLSSLRKLYQYALSSQLISTNPSFHLQNFSPPATSHAIQLLRHFQYQLKSEGATSSTIKNYSSDIRSFLSSNT